MPQLHLRPSRQRGQCLTGPESPPRPREKDAHSGLASLARQHTPSFPVQQHPLPPVLRGIQRQGHALASLLLLLLVQLQEHSLALQRSCALRIRGVRDQCRRLQQGLLLHCSRTVEALGRLKLRGGGRGLLGGLPLASISNPLPVPAGSQLGGHREQGQGPGGRAEGGAWERPVKIEALYVSTCSHYTPNVLTFGYSFKPWTEYWALLSTGEVYLGLPHGDPRAFDFEEERRQNPHRFLALETLQDAPLEGQLRGARGLHYAGRFVPFDPAQDTIAVNEEMVFRRVGSCDGRRLEGTFVHGAPRNFVETSEAFGLQGPTAISFSRDGTFRISGCANVCFRPRPSPDGTADAALPLQETRGRYSIKGNLIEFQYEKGPVEDAFFFAMPCAEDSVVSINGVAYKRTP